MRIVIACPSVIQDGDKIRAELGATQLPYMVIVRGYFPPRTDNEGLVVFANNPIHNNMWVMGQVWDVSDELAKDLKHSCIAEELQLTSLDSESARLVARNQAGTPGARRATFTVTDNLGRGSLYAVSSQMGPVENEILRHGMTPLYGRNSTVVMFPVVGPRGVYYMARNYRDETLENSMQDVMARIHDTIKGPAA